MSFGLGTPHPSLSDPPPAKIDHLHRLAQRRFPIPFGWACPADQAFSTIKNNSSIDALLAQGSVIVRMACEIEDLANASAAGLSLSIGSIHNQVELQHALQKLQEHIDDPWLQQYQVDRVPLYWILIQREIQRKWLIVAAIDALGTVYAEVHSSPHDVLHMGSTPVYSGPLALWDHHSTSTISEICLGVAAEFAESSINCPHGIDLELVVDPHDKVWLVQARPLSADLVSEAQEFVTTVIEPLGSQIRLQLKGLFVLDAEHNPAPLSYAHAWLIDELRRARPRRSGDPIALGGWLYVRTLPRNLDPKKLDPSSTNSIDALRYLSQTLLPNLQQESTTLVKSMQNCSRKGLGDCLSLALEHFLFMIDTYLDHIVPFRDTSQQRLGDSQNPLSLRDRQRFLDILPTSWDIASQSLQDIGIPNTATSHLENEMAIPSDPQLASSLLAEWDDHLFALGLIPLRKTWLRAAQLLELSPNDVFFLSGTELQIWSAGQPSPLDRSDTLSLLVAQRKQQHQCHLKLSAPLRLFDGTPIPIVSGAPLHGISCGPDYTGVIGVFSDLEQLITLRPHPPTIVCLPTLTAQAAVAIQHLGIQAVCTEFGGALSHGALMARELGLSALIGCRGCTSLLDQSQAKIDSKRGRLLVQRS